VRELVHEERRRAGGGADDGRERDRQTDLEPESAEQRTEDERRKEPPASDRDRDGQVEGAGMRDVPHAGRIGTPRGVL
jgi:hypothetical protein